MRYLAQRVPLTWNQTHNINSTLKSYYRNGYTQFNYKYMQFYKKIHNTLNWINIHHNPQQ